MNIEIRTRKCGNIHLAWCMNPGKIKGIITMGGSTAEIAKEKLQLCLDNKPYSHLEKTKK